MNVSVGIDIGGTKTSAAIVDPYGTVLARIQTRTPALDGATAVLGTAITLTRKLLRQLPHDQQLVAVGVGAAGVIDPVRRVVVSATDTFFDWAGCAIGFELESALGVPVAVQNDVHAHALGEARFGAGQHRGTVLVVAAGTGIGGGLVIDGTLQRGSAFLAGHYGHIPAEEARGLPCTCGKEGHLEMIASGPAVLDTYRRNGGLALATDARDVRSLADAGDAIARDVIAVAGRSLGRAIGGLVNALDPEIVVVGGGLANAGPSWWTALRAGVAEECVPYASGRAVVHSALADDAAVIGAASAAVDYARTLKEGATL